jgi:hypothetical protein
VDNIRPTELRIPTKPPGYNGIMLHAEGAFTKADWVLGLGSKQGDEFIENYPNISHILPSNRQR